MGDCLSAPNRINICNNQPLRFSLKVNFLYLSTVDAPEDAGKLASGETGEMFEHDKCACAVVRCSLKGNVREGRSDIEDR